MSTETDTVSDYGLLDTRYAVYFAPPRASALKRFGDAWLGRDPDSDEPVPQPVVEGITPHRLHEITASPRHYGFHATLKAPFYPVPGLESDALLGDIEAFAAARRPLEVRLRVGELGGFLALVPTEPVPDLDRLAADCVREFDRHRAALTPDDRAILRNPSGSVLSGAVPSERPFTMGESRLQARVRCLRILSTAPSGR